MKMKMTEIQELLGADSLGKNKFGNYVARWTFFYRHGKTAQDHAEIVRQAIPGAEIIGSQEHWKAFRGGASVANSSHWAVEFRLPISQA